jgi:fatty-acyl-CoA synthase
MQDQPLLISNMIEFARRHHGDTEVVSRREDGDVHRSTWRVVADRAKRVAQALDAAGMQPSARVATLAWNGYRHLELYFGVSGSGRVLHTINPRLHADQLAWIVAHAEDVVLCFDLSFLPLVQALRARSASIKLYVALCRAEDMPSDSGIPGLVDYESWIGAHDGAYEWPRITESAASSLCYTSGTTGSPKGVLYSHRSTVLHAYAAALPDSFNVSARDSVLPVVPMFHVNAWGLPYIAAMTGCKLVLPGPALDGKSIHSLMEQEQVTLAAGVPTIWQMLLDHVREAGASFSSLTRTIVGGAACPAAMLSAFDGHHVEVLHAWGMTELSPLGTVNAPKRKHLDLDRDSRLRLREKQGRAVFGLDMQIVDGQGHRAAEDGVAVGDLQVRGAWVVREYFGQPANSPLANGWFPTGDIATLDTDGFLRITDRSKDVIKSGGEWISSLEVENIALSHPFIQQAACIGIRHPKWDERPLLVAVTRPGSSVAKAELLSFFEGKIAKWQIPDDVVFVDALPLGPTGKILKTLLRDQFSSAVLRGDFAPATPSGPPNSSGQES